MVRATKQAKEKQQHSCQRRIASDWKIAEGKKPGTKLIVRPMHSKPLTLF